MFAWSHDWNTVFPLDKTLSTLHFQLCRRLKQYVLDCWIVLNIEPDKNIIKEMRIFIDGSLQVFSFCQPKTFKPNEQTTWNTSHLHGIVLSSGKLDYEKLFDVFHEIKVMNAEVFAEKLENYRLLTSLL